MCKSLSCFILATLAFMPSTNAEDALKTAREVCLNTYGPSQTDCRFDLTATVSFTRQEDTSVLISVCDSTGDACLLLNNGMARSLAPGTKVQICGNIHRAAQFRRAKAYALSFLAHEQPPLPHNVSGPDLLCGRFDCKLVRISGTVRDFSVSELNPNYAFLVANCQGERIYISIPTRNTSINKLADLVDVEISAVGISLPFDCTFRAHMGRVFKVSSANSIRTIGHPRAQAKHLPDIDSIGNALPSDIAMLGRHRAIGRVIASWDNDKILLKTSSGQLSQIEITTGQLPAYGDLVEAQGIPETDLFQINLARASWSKLSENRISAGKAQLVTADRLLTASNGVTRMSRHFHGRAVRIRGQVVSMPTSTGPNRTLYLSNRSQVVPVAANAISERLHDIPIGSTVEISGTCVMETEPWRPNMIFTRTKGFVLVTRTPDDIRVIERPSWWTPGRLLAVIGALFSLLFAILVWNFSLRRLSDKKGLALARAKLAQSESALKVQERTRLATELHDSIVQNLTGASLHLRTADKLRTSDPDAVRDQMSIAMKTLDSCRDEIRNCIWDLRNRALDEPRMDDAIRRTLAPHAGDARLAIRFAVPRKLLTDNTAHGIICIIRELVLNAIRHGHATLIQVAGCIDNGRLLFSVKDNGRGFDTETAPGIEQGHFGLQGVRERIGLLQGDVSITSHPNEGTKVSISVRMPKEGKQ